MRKTWMPAVLLCLAATALSRGPWKPTGGPWGGEALCMASVGNTRYVGTPSGLFQSTDNGGSWSAVRLTEEPVHALAATGSGLLVGTWGKGVFLVPGDGGPGRQTGLKEGYITSLAGSGKIFYAGSGALVVTDASFLAGTEGGGTWLSTDGGNTWKEADAGLRSLDINALQASGEGYLAGTPIGIFASADPGRGWHSSSRGLGLVKITGLVASGTRLHAATAEAGVYHSADGGVSWVASGPGLELGTQGVNLAVQGKDLYAATTVGVFHTADFGRSWSALLREPEDGYLPAQIAAPGPGDLIATIPGKVLRSRDKGRTWKYFGIGMTNFDTHFVVRHDGTLFAGNDEGVLRSPVDGDGWESARTGLPAFTIFKAFIETGGRLLVGTDDGIYVSSDRGDSWQVSDTGSGVFGVHAFARFESEIFALTGSVNILHSRDHGRSWKVFEEKLPEGRAYHAMAMAVAGGALYVGTQGRGVWRCALD